MPTITYKQIAKLVSITQQYIFYEVPNDNDDKDDGSE